jgi:hypothetical protein
MINHNNILQDLIVKSSNNITTNANNIGFTSVTNFNIDALNVNINSPYSKCETYNIMKDEILNDLPDYNFEETIKHIKKKKL